jgi:hypothetical protein
MVKESKISTTDSTSYCGPWFRKSLSLLVFGVFNGAIRRSLPKVPKGSTFELMLINF